MYLFSPLEGGKLFLRYQETLLINFCRSNILIQLDLSDESLKFWSQGTHFMYFYVYTFKIDLIFVGGSLENCKIPVPTNNVKFSKKTQRLWYTLMLEQLFRKFNEIGIRVWNDFILLYVKQTWMTQLILITYFWGSLWLFHDGGR